MKGFIFRIGVSLKDFGERAGLQIFINAGISIRDFARKL
jgi:hypothetical protein